MSEEQICNCDYCIAGPFYVDNRLLHFCEYCHEEYRENDLGCPGCAAHERALDLLKEDRWFENN